MKIHITRNGEQHGPYPEATARQFLEEGQLLPADLAWHEGADGWKPLSEVLGTATLQPATPPPPPPKPGASVGAVVSKTVEENAGASEPEDPDEIHVTRKGKAIGSYRRDKAKERYTAGVLLPTDWAWHDGMGKDWKPLNEVLGLPAPPPEKKESSWQDPKDGRSTDWQFKDGLLGNLPSFLVPVFLVLSIALLVAGIFEVIEYVKLNPGSSARDGFNWKARGMIMLGGISTYKCIVRLWRKSKE